MKNDISNPIHWIADEDKEFFSKADNAKMGKKIWLSITDSIDNYEEREVVEPTVEE